MFKRWLRWVRAVGKLAVLLAACLLVVALVSPVFGEARQWVVLLASLAALLILLGRSLFLDPLKWYTVCRPKMARSPEVRKQWRWILWNWELFCIATGLAGEEPTGNARKRLYPTVKGIASGPRGTVWDVEVLVTDGGAQTPSLWIRRSEEIASCIGWPVEVTALSASRVRISILKRAPSQERQFVPLRSSVDLRAPITVGVRSDGSPFRLQLADKQTLLVGASGSGKGAVIASVLAGVGPAIRSGAVTVDAIDLKGGVEAASYSGLLRALAWDYEAALKMLRELVQELEDRLTTMRMSGVRKIEPSSVTPLRLLIIDEAASLVYMAPDNKTKSEVDLLLKRVLSTGRAAGYVVLAALQDPRKEALASRDLYTQTLALRFRTKDDAVLAIGQSAYDAGARCEQIPTALPGTGYAIDGETGEIVRFRSYWVSDTDLKEMVKIYAPSANAGGAAENTK